MQRKKLQRKKLKSIKSLESAVWLECKRIIRAKYSTTHCYICQDEVKELKKLHTGHLFKKGSLHLHHKYDLRILRPCCAKCNLFLDGNEAWYMVKMIEEMGWDSIKSLIDEIRSKPNERLPIPEQRLFLEKLLTEYKSMLY